MKSSTHLPAEVRAAAAGAIGDGPVTEDFAWMSWAGTVWRLSGQKGAVFVKRAAQLEDERKRLEWLAGRWGWPPERVAATLGEILKTLHGTDAADCPFGVRKRGHVLIHGDYCLPNVLVHGGRLSAVIDLGLAGLGNPETDLAAGVWTLQYNFGKGYARAFLDAYGWPPMTAEAIEKLRRKYAR